MNNNTKIAIGVGIGVVIIVAGFVVYKSSHLVNPEIKNTKPEDELDKPLKEAGGKTDTDEETVPFQGVKSDETEVPLLKERIYITENRNKFRDPKTEGHEDFIKRTKAALEETDEKELEFYNTETEYALTKGKGIVALINKL